MHDSHSQSRQTPGGGTRSQVSGHDLHGSACSREHTGRLSISPAPFGREKQSQQGHYFVTSPRVNAHYDRVTVWACAWLPALGHCNNARQSLLTHEDTYSTSLMLNRTAESKGMCILKFKSTPKLIFQQRFSDSLFYTNVDFQFSNTRSIAGHSPAFRFLPVDRNWHLLVLMYSQPVRLDISAYTH